MLVLSRKRGEELVIGNGITVTVLEVLGDRVRFGFVAPADSTIDRKEIHTCRMLSMDEGDAIHRPIDAPTIAEMAMQRLRNSPYKVM